MFTVVYFLYRESVNYAVLSLIENGELAKLENRWWTDETECGYSDKHVSVSLILYQNIRE